MDENPKHIDWERLDRFLTGGSAPHEHEAIKREIESDPELSRIVETLRTIGGPAGEPREIDVNAAWVKMQERMRQSSVRPMRVLRSATEPAIQRRFEWRWRSALAPALTLAAALVLVAGVATLLLEHRHGRSTIAEAPTAAREVITRRGELATLDLADGSRVVLGPESRLTIPGGFDAAKTARPRELELSGEGYFKVKHDSTRPFRVVTATAVTEDIGTSFVVSAYPDVRTTRVVVEEGSVALRERVAGGPDGRAQSPRRGETRPLVVSAGKLAQVDERGKATRIGSVNVASYVAWTRGSIVFEGTPFSDAIPQLERWYDLRITLADSTLRTRRLTGSFSNASETQMLEQLAIVLDVRVARTGRTVVLSLPRKAGVIPR